MKFPKTELKNGIEKWLEKDTNKPSVIDLFSGSGGLSLGFSMGGLM